MNKKKILCYIGAAISILFAVWVTVIDILPDTRPASSDWSDAVGLVFLLLTVKILLYVVGLLLLIAAMRQPTYELTDDVSGHAHHGRLRIPFSLFFLGTVVWAYLIFFGYNDDFISFILAIGVVVLYIFALLGFVYIFLKTTWRRFA